MTKKLVFYVEPPVKCDWAIEYVVLEFWSGVQNLSDFKCIVCTTHSQELAEKIVMENEINRTWVKAWRLFPE